MFIGTLPSVCDTQAEAAEHKKTWTGLAAQSHLGSGSVWHSMTAPDVVKDTAKRLKIMRVDRVRQSDVRANLIEQVWAEFILPHSRPLLKCSHVRCDTSLCQCTQLAGWYSSAVNRTGMPEGEYNWPRLLWNAGRIAHTIGDSFSCSHTVRSASAPYKVLFFQVGRTCDVCMRVCVRGVTRCCAGEPSLNILSALLAAGLQRARQCQTR